MAVALASFPLGLKRHYEGHGELSTSGQPDIGLATQLTVSLHYRHKHRLRLNSQSSVRNLHRI